MTLRFVDYISRYKKLVLILLGTSIVSYFAVFYSNLAPPIHNARAIFFISIVIESAAIIAVYKRRILRSSLEVTLLIFSLGLYFSSHALLTFEIPTSASGQRDVKGFVCLPSTEGVYPSSCPLLSVKELQEARFEPRKLWTDWSVSLAKIFLVFFWGAFIWFASRFVAMFALSSRARV
jgi:hypothetical protein